MSIFFTCEVLTCHVFPFIFISTPFSPPIVVDEVPDVVIVKRFLVLINLVANILVHLFRHFLLQIQLGVLKTMNVNTLKSSVNIT